MRTFAQLLPLGTRIRPLSSKTPAESRWVGLKGGRKIERPPLEASEIQRYLQEAGTIAGAARLATVPSSRFLKRMRELGITWHTQKLPESPATTARQKIRERLKEGA